MKVLFAASEAVPFCKTGGLADVVGALTLALRQKKNDVRLVLPKYRAIDAGRFGLKPLHITLRIPMGDSFESVELWEARLEKTLPVYFIDAPKYFERDGLYRDTDGTDFSDNDERFILFSRAVLETVKAVDFRPDVLHCHDWQTGLIPAYLETLYRMDAFFIPTSTLFTVHNIAYQGLFPKNAMFVAGFSWADFTPTRLEFYDQLNFMKAGLVFSRLLNTVSPSYAREIQNDEVFGRGMEGLLRARRQDLFGILNGVDTRAWNPMKDAHLAHRFSASKLEPRAACKKDLQRASGLNEDPGAPLLGMVSRLDPQKGFDMVLDVVEEFVAEGAQFLVLGQGDRALETAFTALVEKHPGRIAVSTAFNEVLAHKIYGGADIFLMPSRFEPCGLGQMIALLYGAVPLVAPTGGLLDSVPPFQPSRDQGVGFVMEDIHTPALAKSLREALGFFRKEPDTWRALQRRGMTQDFSWANSLEKYLELYRLAQLRKRQAPDFPS